MGARAVPILQLSEISTMGSSSNIIKETNSKFILYMFLQVEDLLLYDSLLLNALSHIIPEFLVHGLKINMELMPH